MTSFVIAFSVVGPIVILIATGCVIRILNLLTADVFRQMNKLVFYVLLPCLIFSNINSTSIETAVNFRLALYGVAGIFATFLIGIFVARASTKDPRKRGAVLQSLFRSNFILYGLLIVQSLYGDQTAVTTLLIAFAIPLFNVLAVIGLEMFRGGTVNITSILINMVKNPLIITTAVAILFNLSSLTLPDVVLRPVTDLARSATPIALIVLGGIFEWKSIRNNRNLLVMTTILKLVVWPVVFLSIAVVIGFRNVELLSLAALFGSPSAVSSLSMAQQMNSDSEFTSQNILLTTVLSIFTVFIMIAVLSHFSLI